MKRNIIITIISVLMLTCTIAFARTTTTDLNLVKPTWTENVDILDDLNANSDILEAFANDVLEFDLSPVLRANLDIATFDIEGVDATEFGYLNGVTAFGGTLIDDADASAARTTLDLVIGTNIQAYDAALASISGLTYASASFIKLTAEDTYVVRTLSEVRTDLGLVIGTNVMAWDAQLDDIAALEYTDGNFIVGDGSNWVAESGSTARASLGLIIGTNVEAHDDGLLSIAGLTTVGGSILYTTASDSYSVVAPNTTTITKFLRMVGTGSAYQAPTWESINPQQVISVAKAGGDYTTIQGAIDSITDNTTSKRYIIIISPGTYTEDITMEDFVSLEGMGKRSNVVIDGTLTFATDANDVSGLRNLTISKTLTADLTALIISASQTHIIRDCTISLSSSTNGVKATMFDIDAGTFRLEESTINLTFTGSTGADAEITIIFDIEAASTIITDNKFDIDIGDIDDIVILFDESGVAITEILFDYNTVHIDINNASSTGAAGIAYLHGTGTNNNFAYNHLHIASTGNGTGYCYYSNGSSNSTVHSNSNRVIVEGFTNNYFYYVSSGDTLTSHFDDVVATTTSVSAGTVNIVSSLSDGSLKISGQADFGSLVLDNPLLPAEGGTGLSSLGTNVATFLGAPSSANLASAVTDETGTGKVVYNIAPILYQNVTTSSSTNTLTVAEAGLILVSDAHTETLPTASGNTGLTYHFVKTDWDYDLITLEGDGAETFNYENSTGSPNITYLRLNTPLAEVTIVSDGANWQVINEALGQVPEIRVYLGAHQLDLKEQMYIRAELDTEDYDIGNNFDISEWVSGTADENTANHLVDDGTSPFTTAMVGVRVQNTNSSDYAYVISFVDAGDLELNLDIFPNGNEPYQIMHSKFVAPISGKYIIRADVIWIGASVVALKKYTAAIYVNNSVSITNDVHSALNAYLLNSIIGINVVLAKDDYVELRARQEAQVDTVDIRGTADTPTFLKVILISKD